MFVGAIFSMVLVAAAPVTERNLLDTELTAGERAEVDARLESFYRQPASPEAMNLKAPKFNALTGEAAAPNAFLRSEGPEDRDPLLKQAGVKVTRSFQENRCNRFLKKHFPGLKCEGDAVWETLARNERPENLVETWADPQSVTYDLEWLPSKGQVRASYWSGDYWRMRWGLTSYRYADKKKFAYYRNAVAAYHQPEEWTSLVSSLDPESWVRTIQRWSPAEKYDLTVGDESFYLTNNQKREGEKNLTREGNVEEWYGICHGWAPASLFVPPPTRPVWAFGPRGARVEWYPDEIRAMAALSWANGNYETNFLGGRCNAKRPTVFRNGRLTQKECFDVNPATFHIALGNVVGRMQKPFIFDSHYDHEVWNQPILSYGIVYFNPLNRNQRSYHWGGVSVPYDMMFKQRDRFQWPLTRGLRMASGRNDDSGVRRIVGVMATVVYLAGNVARFGPQPAGNGTLRVTYTYDLEIHAQNGRWVPLGGEWHQNAHPDFLWIPKRGSMASMEFDRTRIEVNLNEQPWPETTALAQLASEKGYPLCRVLKSLVEASSGSSMYECPAAQ